MKLSHVTESSGSLKIVIKEIERLADILGRQEF